MKSKFLILSIISVLTLNYTFGEDNPGPKPKYGPKDAPYATTLSASSEYFRSPKHPAPDFWNLIGYYVPQFNELSCSAASLSMVLNAARTRLPKTADDKLVLQQELIEKIKVEDWKQRLSPEGFGPKKEHGVSLDQLGRITEAAFHAYGFLKATVEVVHLDASNKMVKLHQALVTIQTSQKDYLIANFNQQSFTNDADAGHIAPVAAYDAEKKRALILDPDREWYEPYWVSENTLFNGMSTKDSLSNSSRGYVFIHLNQSLSLLQDLRKTD